MGFLFPKPPPAFKPEPVASPDDDAVRRAGEQERQRRRSRLGGLGTILVGSGSDLKTRTGE